MGFFVPGSKAAAFLGEALPRLTAEDLGAAIGLRVFFWRRASFTRSLFRVPDEETCVYVAILRAPTTEPDVVARMLAGNRTLLERNRALGGTLYPFSAVQTSGTDWEQHYGAAWPTLVRTKRRHDPDRVLASGPDLFRDAAGR
jgi:FAD/FMN-containing dehydrogenase